MIDWQQKGNPTYALLFVDLDKPCLWYHPSPMRKASQIRSETRMVRKSIGEMIPENTRTRIETVAVSVFGMVHTRKDRIPKSPTKE
jgi:ribosomal protein L13